ncbi:MAG: TetR/AcrR family transcriptional regulator [Anaerocolumna sp.]
MANKMTSRGKQALATKKRIYNSGIRLIKQHGYENITVAQIAKKADVSIGTFYHHFQSKFDLLAEIYRIGDVFFKERVPELLLQYESCIERVVEYFCLYALLSIQNGIEMVRNLYLPTNEMFLSHGRAMQNLLTDILHLGQEQGELTDSLSPEIIMEKLFVVARGVIFDWCLHNGKSDLVTDMRDIIRGQTLSYLS